MGAKESLIEQDSANDVKIDENGYNYNEDPRLILATKKFFEKMKTNLNVIPENNLNTVQNDNQHYISSKHSQKSEKVEISQRSLTVLQYSSRENTLNNADSRFGSKKISNVSSPRSILSLQRNTQQFMLSGAILWMSNKWYLMKERKKM